MPRGVNQGGPDDELVARLRIGADEDDQLVTSVVAFATKHGVAGDLAGRKVKSENGQDMRKAADRIQSLLRTIDDLERKLGVVEGVIFRCCDPFNASEADAVVIRAIAQAEFDRIEAPLSDSPIDKGGE